MNLNITLTEEQVTIIKRDILNDLTVKELANLLISKLVLNTDYTERESNLKDVLYGYLKDQKTGSSSVFLHLS
jgi:hypothetical protein